MSTLSFSIRRHLVQHTNLNNSPLGYAPNVALRCGSRKVAFLAVRVGSVGVDKEWEMMEFRA